MRASWEVRSLPERWEEKQTHLSSIHFKTGNCHSEPTGLTISSSPVAPTGMFRSRSITHGFRFPVHHPVHQITSRPARAGSFSVSKARRRYRPVHGFTRSLLQV